MASPLHVEIAQQRRSTASQLTIKEIVNNYLSKFESLTPGTVITNAEFEDEAALKEHVFCISICDMYSHSTKALMGNTELVFHVHRLESSDGEADTITDGGGEEVAAATLWPLPSEELHGLWESLIYNSAVKEDTLRFAEVALELSERGVDPNLISCNRVVLLHGPPGTGKTALCRALAHKLAVRLGARFPRATLVEVNAHSLFSRWFSESGKLVARMFGQVRELLNDPRLLVIVLVDEVESLAHARVASGLEPSDALRAVNAVLTQLDALRRRPNALVLTTSNMTGAVDAAFVDRADLRVFVGPPAEPAARTLLMSGLRELVRVGAVSSPHESYASELMGDVARSAVGDHLSGRALRKLPLLALVRSRTWWGGAPLSLTQYVTALRAALADHATGIDGHSGTPIANGHHK